MLSLYVMFVVEGLSLSVRLDLEAPLLVLVLGVEGNRKLVMICDLPTCITNVCRQHKLVHVSAEETGFPLAACIHIALDDERVFVIYVDPSPNVIADFAARCPVNRRRFDIPPLSQANKPAMFLNSRIGRPAYCFPVEHRVTMQSTEALLDDDIADLQLIAEQPPSVLLETRFLRVHQEDFQEKFGGWLVVVLATRFSGLTSWLTAPLHLELARFGCTVLEAWPLRVTLEAPPVAMLNTISTFTDEPVSWVQL